MKPFGLQPSAFLQEAAQQLHRLDILGEVLSLGCLEDLRDRGQFRSGHDPAEGIETDLPVAQIVVAVDAGAERSLGVVDVQDGEALQADHPVELGEGLGGALRCGEIVSCGEGVGGVETDFQAFGVLHRFEDPGDFLEARAEAGPLARSGLKRDPDPELRMLGMEPIEIPDNARDPRLQAGPQMRPGVEDKGADAKLLAAEHLVRE